jgi:sulfite exporter TauE/SafE
VGIGIFGIGLGVGISKIEVFEGIRGDVASYLMIAFGLVYLAWSIKKLLRSKEHYHSHGFGKWKYSHNHLSVDDQKYFQDKKRNNLFWGIFIVFLFGPCEPLIPLLMYPAAKTNVMSCVIVSLTFTVVTVLTMLVSVFVSLKGLSFLRLARIERYSHALASLTIIICGVLIIFGL